MISCTGVILVSYWKQNHAEKKSQNTNIITEKSEAAPETSFKVEDVWRKVFWIYAGSFTRFLVVAGVLLVVLEALRVVEEVLWVFEQVLDL